MKPVIHSQKHYVQISRSTVAAVSANTEDLIKSVEVQNKDALDEVEEGALVKAIYIELWLLNQSNDGSDVIIVQKGTAAAATATFTQMNSLGTYVFKKNILFTHQGLSSNNGVGNPINVLRGWIKIPKSKQRFGLGDNLLLTIANNGASILEYCGFATYKEYN